ncbi:MAG TPA: YcxB family protein [Spirochaetota bacterium]|nr:YcxB family protein [Spirochaetota bacterium]HSA14736.1 YcxB family protein [Spirochaetota bacterium]
MKIRYTSRFEDFIEFSVFHHTSPKKLRKLMLRQLMLVIVFSAAIIGTLYYISFMKNDYYYLKFGFLVIPMFMVSQYMAYKKYPKKIREEMPRYLKEADHRDFAGDHEIEILDDGILEKPSGEKTEWMNIREVTSTNRHTFIYISDTRAHVIPRERVKKKAYENFMKELEKRRTSCSAAGDR